jgi:signal recognition particle receptor subunit beta
LELSKLLKEDELKYSKLLVLCNKQDLPNALSVAEIVQKLKLHDIKGRDWVVHGTCARTGDGVFEGFEWLSSVCL